MAKIYHLLFCLIFITSPIAAESQLIGNWHGYAKAGNEQTGFIVHIETDDRVSVSLTDIGVSKIPGQKVKLKANKITFILPSDSGPQKIKLSLKNNQLVGTWQDNPDKQAANLVLTKSTAKSALTETKLIIQGADGDIGVSVMLPPGLYDLNQADKQLPAVVLTHGSGKTTRDVARFVAESFAKQGIVAIFYDKRGVGLSEGDYDEITFELLADDAITIAKYFAEQPSIGRIGFWGHSQGGWIAPLAASRWQPSAFAIMSAGPLVTPAREGDWTFVRDARAYPESTPYVQKLAATWHDGIRDGDFSHFNKLKDKYEDEPWFDASGIDNLRTWFTSSYFRSYRLYMDYDPMLTFNKLTKPVLSMYALQDESINAHESIAIAEDLIARGKNIELVKYDGYGHSMRKLPKPGKALRFPNFPEDYFDRQAKFIKNNTKTE